MRLVLLFLLATSLGACHRADAELRFRVEQRLRAASAPAEVEVTADRSVVILRGVVPSAVERLRVERIARAVPGVRAVDDRLVVAQPPSLTAATSDAELAAAIGSALAAAGFPALKVEIAGATVRVRGHVPGGCRDKVTETVLRAAPNLRVDDQTTPE